MGMGRPALDLTGNRYGRLVAIRRDGSCPKTSNARWLCRCDCGVEKTYRGDHLRRGTSRSCGCLNAELSRQRGDAIRADLTGLRFGSYTVLGQPLRRPATPGSKGGGNVSWLCRCDCGREVRVQASRLKYVSEPKCRKCANDDLFKPEGWLVRCLLKRYRHNAEARGIEFRLTPEEFSSLLSQPCLYCGRVGARTLRHPSRKEITANYNGVDRLNGGNYEAGNVAACCWRCNRVKSDMKLDEFVSLCRLVASRFETP